jgi:ribulose-5-phosphate 4-epimerase/fuculose-1-phosphate aldolase
MTTTQLDPVQHDTAKLDTARLDLATAFRAAARNGLHEGIDNHLSFAVPGSDDLFMLNRFGVHWSEMTPADILVIDFDGNVIDGDGDWEISAFIIHRACHRARSSARAVFHTHMPNATAVACTATGFVDNLSQNALYFRGRHARLQYGGLADAAEEGDRIATAIGGHVTAAFLDNHGVIVVGNDIADAWYKLYMLERACEVQVLAQSTGQPLRVVDVATADATAAWQADDDRTRKLFDAERRLVW